MHFVTMVNSDVVPASAGYGALLLILAARFADSATWCFVCDTLKDNRCYDPAAGFFTPVDQLISYINASSAPGIFSFTASSYIKVVNGNAQPMLMEPGTVDPYCTKTTYMQFGQVQTKCAYRPGGLRLVNCDVMLQAETTPHIKQCLKIDQTVGLNSITVDSVIRTCVAAPDGSPASQQVKTVSIDGNVKSTRSTCSDSLCNTGSGFFVQTVVLMNTLLVLGLTVLVSK